MIKLYTKGGDNGNSGFIGEQNISKDDPIFEVLGTIDELNSHIGLSLVGIEGDIRKELLNLQDMLLSIGSEIAGGDGFRVSEENILFLESRIDVYQKGTRADWYTKFLFPGGTKLAAHLDVSRAVSRRLERRMVAFVRENKGFALVLKYFNRLSDYFFALRCFVNSEAGYEEKEF